jgi:hypothetical protein
MIQPKDPDEQTNRENVDARTRELTGALSFGDPAAEDALQEWFQMFPESLYRVAGTGITHNAELFVHPLLAGNRECCDYLCDPAILDVKTAVALARSLRFREPRLDRRIVNAAIDWAGSANHKLLRRGLDILEAMVPCPGIEGALIRLLKCVDGRARSRVIDILVRSSTEEAGIRQWLRDPDPRVRANVLESLAETRGEKEWVRQVLLEHLRDPHWRVAANAAVGLCDKGLEESALARLTEMASSDDSHVRCSSAWAMGRVMNPSVLEFLHRLRKDPDERVRWNALRSLARLNKAGVRQTSAEPVPNPAELATADEAQALTA